MNRLIFNRVVGPGTRCYIVAELGSNHNNDIEQARSLIRVASGVGANAVKLQLFRADTLYSKRSEPEGWAVARRYEVPYEWLPILRDYAHECGVGFICSVFCRETLEQAELYCDALKIASAEAGNSELVDAAVYTCLPVMVSTGLQERPERLGLRARKDIFTLACNAVYPSEISDFPLRELPYSDGISDHTLSTWLPALAVSHGACIVEKHLTPDRNAEGPDHLHSIVPGEFFQMVENIRMVEHGMVYTGDGPTPSEKGWGMVKYRTSIHAARPIKKGQMLTREDFIIQRPNDGGVPSSISALVGALPTREYEVGEGIARAELC